jgi:hypothetical protein
MGICAATRIATTARSTISLYGRGTREVNEKPDFFGRKC